ncbi:MAG: transglycosylase SLT domain-containing protein, partial [Deltaproteobacteria bacterium]|nr:transglycosylase SLT domain-containing protein [Deltaproteobacteria bacterium]
MTRLRRLAFLLFALPLAAHPQAQEEVDPDFPDVHVEKPKSTREQFEDAQRGMRQHIDEAQEHQRQEFAELSERMQEQYEAYQERMVAQRARFVARMAQQWAEVKESTSKGWVDYAEKGDARSSVDFDKGEVEIEVLIPVEDVAPGRKGDAPLTAAEQERLRKLAQEKLAEQTKRMLETPDPMRPGKNAPVPPKKADATTPTPTQAPTQTPTPTPTQTPTPTPTQTQTQTQTPTQTRSPPPPPPTPAPPPPAHAQAPAPSKTPAPSQTPPAAAPAKSPTPPAAQAQTPPPPAPRAPPPPSGTPVLEGQLRSADGKPVTPKNADEFIEKTLAPKLEVDSKPVVGKDGKARVKAKVKVAMVPDHLKIRADRYATQVNAQAAKLGIDPALVFAVIHTESAFNPMARSGAGAYGLMQLLPKQGAHEAYRHLYGKEKVITAEDLYDPDVNIMLGATYL